MEKQLGAFCKQTGQNESVVVDDVSFSRKPQQCFVRIEY